MKFKKLRRDFGAGVALLFSLFIMMFGVVGFAGVAASAPAPAASHAVQDPAPNGDNGTTIDPLQYNCGNDAPTCGQVGESNGYYNGTNVDLLYSENYYCDANVTSGGNDGCEAGAGPSTYPERHVGRELGTSLGNTTHGDTLYIPVPLFSQSAGHPVHGDGDLHRPPADHRPVTHSGRSAGEPVAEQRVERPDPGAQPCGRDPEQRRCPNGGTSRSSPPPIPATFTTLTSVSAINAAVTAGTAVSAPTNAFLFFQVLPGTLSASMAANLTATAPPGAAVPAAPAAPPASQVEPGTTFNNLMNDCGATAPNCQNIGISRDWIDGQDVEALYTEQYYCGTTSVAVHSSTGCEAGSDPTSVPPGVADTTPPTPTVTNSQIDPLYIPVPLYASPAGALRPVLGRQHVHRPPGDHRPVATGVRARVPRRRPWTTSGCPATTTC